MIGTVLNIQRFSLQDGPGIRTTVYLKGCPLHCQWCSNPESIKPQAQLGYSISNCKQCMACIEKCKYNALVNINSKLEVIFKNCLTCGECIDSCLYNALEIFGKEQSSDDIISTVEKDLKYYIKTGGGITISGGEPFYQFDFLLSILKSAKKKGIHTCIETSGFAEADEIKEATKYTDLFLYDFKLSNIDDHIKYTLKSNKKILENLLLLNQWGSKIILRCVIVPSINDTPKHFKAISELSNSLENVIETNILPYHDFARNKYTKIGDQYKMTQTTVQREVAEKWLSQLKNMGCKNVKNI